MITHLISLDLSIRDQEVCRPSDRVLCRPLPGATLFVCNFEITSEHQPRESCACVMASALSNVFLFSRVYIAQRWRQTFPTTHRLFADETLASNLAYVSSAVAVQITLTSHWKLIVVVVVVVDLFNIKMCFVCT